MDFEAESDGSPEARAGFKRGNPKCQAKGCSTFQIQFLPKGVDLSSNPNTQNPKDIQHYTSLMTTIHHKLHADLSYMVSLMVMLMVVMVMTINSQ